MTYVMPEPPTMMRGPYIIRRAICAYLEDKIPAQIERARQDWGLDAVRLPLPEKIAPYERYGLDHYPMLAVVLTNAKNFARVAYDDFANEQYEAVYTCRIFTWVRTAMDTTGMSVDDSYQDTLRLRDDYAAVVRSLLLLSSSLGQPAIIWDETSLNEEYSDATSVKGDRWVAGVTHTFEVQVDESAVRSMIGTADEFTIAAEPLGG